MIDTIDLKLKKKCAYKLLEDQKSDTWCRTSNVRSDQVIVEKEEHIQFEEDLAKLSVISL